MEKQVSFNHAFKFAFRSLLEHFFLLFGSTVLAGIILFVVFLLPAIILFFIFHVHKIALIICLLPVALLIISWLQLGLIQICFDVHDTGNSHFSRLWSVAAKVVFTNFISGLLFWGGVLLGTIFLIIPGMILFVAWAFSSLIILTEHVGPIAALSRSWQLTKGIRGQLFVFEVIMSVLSSIPVVNILVFPFSLLVLVCLFRQRQKPSSSHKTHSGIQE